MNSAFSLLPANWMDALGWTILHSLWQGALIAALAWSVLRALRNFPAATRYRVAFAALALVPLLAVITFLKVYEPAQVYHGDTAGSFVLLLQDQTQSLSQSAAGFQWTALLPYVVLLWLAGAAFFALRFTGGLLLLQRLRSAGQKGLPWHIHAQLINWKNELGIKRVVRIAESALVKTPMLVGYLKPVILLPLGCAAGLPKEQLEALMAHELAHVARHDFIANLIQELLHIVFFYHPAIWWLNKTIRDERESCCDELAFGMGVEKINLAKALASLEEQRLTTPALAMAATGKGNLLSRISRMFRPSQQPTVRERVGASVLLLFGLIILSTSVAVAQGYKDKKEKKEADAAQDDSLIARGDTVKKKTPPPAPPSPPSPPSPPAPPTPPTPPAPPAPPKGYFYYPGIGQAQHYNFTMPGMPAPYVIDDGTESDKHIKIKRDKKGRVTEIWIDDKKLDPSEWENNAIVLPHTPDPAMEAEWEAYEKTMEKYSADWEKYGKDWEKWAEQWQKYQHSLPNTQLGKLGDELSILASPNIAIAPLPSLPGFDSQYAFPESEDNAMAYAFAYPGMASNPKIDSLRKALEAEMEKERAKMQNDYAKMAEDYTAKAKEYEKQAAEYEKKSRATMDALEDQLLRDKLITDKKDYRFEISNKELKVNGKTQSAELRDKYLSIVKKFNGNFDNDDVNYIINKNDD